ncbi:MAG: hypothetical protein H0X16_10380, partial [Chloroflexi bacterium]|nr:hypothetical protein [Chloroflexota bacterium]
AEGTPGGSVVIGEWQPPDNLNPYYSNAFATSEVLYSTHPGLWETSSDGHWVPDLASKMPTFGDGSVREIGPVECTYVPPPPAEATGEATGEATAEATEAATAEATAEPEPENGFEVDLEMPPGLKWSDGEALDLNDLRYTWEWNLDPDQVGLVTGTTGWEDIATFEVAEDGLTATVTFCAPFAGFYGLLGSTILPEHYFSEIPVAEASERSMPVSAAIADVPSSGPFMFQEASPQAITLVRNPNYTSETACGTQACLEEVTYQFYADVDGMKAAFLAGELDVALNMLAADFDSIKNVDPAIGEALNEPVWEYEHLDFNQGDAIEGVTGSGHEMLQDVNVRKALYQAIDKEDLFATLFPGQPAPPTACSNTPPGLYWRVEDLDCPAFSVEEATAALEAAGWTDTNGDGTVDKDGAEAVLEACTSAGRPVRELTLQKVAEYFGAIGVKVNVNLVDSTAVLFAGWNDVEADTKCSIYRGTYDLALYAYVLTFDLFGDFYFSYHSTQIPDLPPHDGGNTIRYSNPEMDAALDVLASEIETTSQIEAAIKIQELYVSEAIEVPLYYRTGVRGKSVRLQNFFKNPGTSTDMWNIEDWFIQE